jgi:hypothetical protein
MVVGLPIGILFSATGLVGADPNPLALASMSGLSIGGAILLRRHWQSLRSGISQGNDWLFDHPVVSIGLYVLIGILFSLGMGVSIAHIAFGGALWGCGGWWNVSRDRRRRGNAAA